MLTTRPKVVEIINYNIYKYYGETWIINQNGEVHYESLKVMAQNMKMSCYKRFSLVKFHNNILLVNCRTVILLNVRHPQLLL